jgi:hypothetical protein
VPINESTCGADTDAGDVVTVSVSGLTPGDSSLEEIECEQQVLTTDKLAQCDELAGSSFDAAGNQLTANASGDLTDSVTVWKLPTAPSDFDPLSTINVSASNGIVLWIGDDPSNLSTGVFTSVDTLYDNSTVTTPESPLAVGLPIGAVVVLAGGVALTLRRRRQSSRPAA